MARYEHLPIYKQALDVAVHFEKVVAGFSRYHKYTLGSELRNKSRDIVSLIVEANTTQDKHHQLVKVRETLDELLILYDFNVRFRGYFQCKKKILKVAL